MPTIASNHNYHKSALAQNFFQTATQPVRRFVDNEKRYVFEMVKSWHRGIVASSYTKRNY